MRKTKRPFTPEVVEEFMKNAPPHEARKPVVETGRERRDLEYKPSDLDFTMKDGNTEYEVVGWFDPDAEETVMQKVIGHADEKLDSPRSQRRNYSVRTTEVYERRDAKSR